MDTKQCHIHACFEELETFKIMSMTEKNGKLIFKGGIEEVGKRNKEFFFDSISFMDEKYKHNFGGVIKRMAESLLRGENRAAILFGAEESKKQRLLVGESQNPGILLLLVWQLFQTCYDNEWEDRVTLKISCCEYREGYFNDPLAGNKMGEIIEDKIQKNIIFGIPEIIIRNLKSALKIIRLYMKNAQILREKDEAHSQTLIFTIKAEIDEKRDKLGNTTDYTISKIHIINLGNPINDKITAKQSPWFINLFNYLQAVALEKTVRTPDNLQEDDFSRYLRDSILENNTGIDLFTSFTNKTDNNECLTALKFSTYLSCLKPTFQPVSFSVQDYKDQKLILENELIKMIEERTKLIKLEAKELPDWLKNEQLSYCGELQQAVALNLKLMQKGNYFQYEYAVNLTTVCDKLEKYIFNEELEDYYYAKKIQFEAVGELVTAQAEYVGLRRELKERQGKLLKSQVNLLNRLKKEKESKCIKFWLNMKGHEKNILEGIFPLYNTLILHYLYEQSQEFAAKIAEYQRFAQELFQPKINIEDINLAAPLQEIIDQTMKQQTPKEKVVEAKEQVVVKKKKLDETEMMFRNSNASFCGRRFKS